jgi:peptidoglycan/xylan/chitin deacetylase (PgdA/CDA1 family)
MCAEMRPAPKGNSLHRLRMVLAMPSHELVPFMSHFRLDREISITLSRLWPLMRRPGAARIPTLMYHGIRAATGRRHPYFETNTTPQLFAAQMKYLRDNHYAAIDLTEARKAIASGPDGRKRVVITFDDGFREVYTRALPILAEYGFSATVFIISGVTKSKRLVSDENEYLTWEEVCEMQALGVQIGSHSVNHGELYALSTDALDYEIGKSKETIEDRLGEAVRSFSYPYAFPEQDKRFSEKLKKILEAHGYESGVTTILGTAGPSHDPFFLPRLPVNAYDDLQLFRAKLEGGYDWLHLAQKAYKKTVKRLAKVATVPEFARNS